MVDKGNGKPSYYRAVWGRTYADWKPTRDRLIWGAITAALGFGGAIYAGSRMTPPQRPLEAGAIGAVGAVVLAALLYLLWHRYRAPAQIWADDRQAIAELTTSRERLEVDKARQAQQFAERDSEIARLKEANAELEKTRSQLQAQLDARRGIELVPRLAKRNKPIQALPADQGVTVVWGTLIVTVINHDEHPATIARLWLRVSDPITNEEIQPLNASDLPSFAGLVEPIKERQPLEASIGARSQQEVELDFCAYYPIALSRMTRQEIASLVTLYATAPGVGAIRCALGEEFFEVTTTP